MQLLYRLSVKYEKMQIYELDLIYTLAQVFDETVLLAVLALFE